MTEAPQFKGMYSNDPWVHYTEDGMDKTDPRTRRFKGRTFHGDMDFDVPFMSVVDERKPGLPYPLWQGGCEGWLVLPKDIKHVVSLYTGERYIVEHDLLSETYISMADSTDQGTGQVSLLAEWVNLCRQTGSVLVSCQAGLNRSSLIVAKSLHLNGFGSGDEIVEHLRKVRSPAALCNPAFEKEVRSWK
jgi:protein-tyrosine phosphatase